MTEVDIDLTDATPINRMIDILVESNVDRKTAVSYIALAYDMGRAAGIRQHSSAIADQPSKVPTTDGEG